MWQHSLLEGMQPMRRGREGNCDVLNDCSTISLWDGKDGACLKFNTCKNGERKHTGIKVCVYVHNVCATIDCCCECTVTTSYHVPGHSYCSIWSIF